MQTHPMVSGMSGTGWDLQARVERPSSCHPGGVCEQKHNEIYFLERLYFSATDYFIFIAKVDF